MPTIKCTVTECQYNNDIRCDAPMIQVNHNNGAKVSQASEETQCDTFRP